MFISHVLIIWYTYQKITLSRLFKQTVCKIFSSITIGKLNRCSPAVNSNELIIVETLIYISQLQSSNALRNTQLFVVDILRVYLLLDPRLRYVRLEKTVHSPIIDPIRFIANLHKIRNSKTLRKLLTLLIGKFEMSARSLRKQIRKHSNLLEIRAGHEHKRCSADSP